MSLYRTGFLIRRIFVLFWVFIGLLISLGLIGRITDGLVRNVTKTSCEKASRGFGEFSPPSIVPSGKVNIFKPTKFGVDTSPSGNLPSLDATFRNGCSDPANENLLVNIYQIQIPTLQNESRTIGLQLAKDLEFNDPAKETNDGSINFSWADDKRRLTYNVEMRTFEYFTNNISTVDTASATPGDPNVAQQYLTNLLRDINIKTDDPLSYFRSVYVKYNYETATWDLSPNNQPTNFVMSYYGRYSRARGNTPLPSFIDSDSTKADPHIVKEFYAGYDYSSMYLITKNTQIPKASDVVEIKFDKYNYDVTKPNVYDTKSVNDAYNDIQNGKGTLVAVRKQKTGESIDNAILSGIKDVKVIGVAAGYYISPTRPEYAFPVYVFTTQFVTSTTGTNQEFGEAVYYVYAYR